MIEMTRNIHPQNTDEAVKHTESIATAQKQRGHLPLFARHLLCHHPPPPAPAPGINSSGSPSGAGERRGCSGQPPGPRAATLSPMRQPRILTRSPVPGTGADHEDAGISASLPPPGPGRRGPGRRVLHGLSAPSKGRRTGTGDTCDTASLLSPAVTTAGTQGRAALTPVQGTQRRHRERRHWMTVRRWTRGPRRVLPAAARGLPGAPRVGRT